MAVFVDAYSLFVVVVFFVWYGDDDGDGDGGGGSGSCGCGCVFAMWSRVAYRNLMASYVLSVLNSHIRTTHFKSIHSSQIHLFAHYIAFIVISIVRRVFERIYTIKNNVNAIWHDEGHIKAHRCILMRTCGVEQLSKWTKNNSNKNNTKKSQIKSTSEHTN